MSLDLISPRTFVKPPRASAFLFIFLLLIACKKNDYQVTPAFYHWQTHFELSPEEQSLLDSLQVEKLYVKFFDVDWDFQQQEALPLAQVRFRQDSIPYQIIPTVFITNRTLEHLSVEAPDTLAARIYKQIKKLSNKVTLEEVQIDCDWTQSTKNKYFRLLKALRKQLPDSTQLSATIRLHQVKYARQTGVPPVDRGMLMFYNVGDVEDWYTENSILDLETARQYLQNFQRYPLPLDMALPLFSWGVLFRQGKMINLISQLEPEELADTGRFEKIGAHRYEVIESNYLKGYYLYKGDWIRLERISDSTLKESALLLKNILKKNDLSLSFYHLDTATIKNHSYEQLESVLRIMEGSNHSE